MSARVTRANSSHAMFREIAGHFFVAQQRTQMPFHTGAVFRDEKIAAWLEKIFGVTPRRTDERNSASESFERPNRGNAREGIYIRTTGNMQRHPKTREDFRHAVIRHPTAVRNSGVVEHVERCLRISNPENCRAEAKRFNRFNQDLLQFVCALIVSPVTEPDHITLKVTVARHTK